MDTCAGMKYIFANKNTSIIELIPLCNSYYEDLSKSLGFKYKQFVLQQICLKNFYKDRYNDKKYLK